MPVPLTVTLENGTSRDVTLPVDPWLAGDTFQRITIDVAAPVVRIEIDAARAFPDSDRIDNAWTRPR